MLEMTFEQFLERVSEAQAAWQEVLEASPDNEHDEYGIDLLTVFEEQIMGEYSPKNQVTLTSVAAILDASDFSDYFVMNGADDLDSFESAEDVIRSIFNDCFEGHVKEGN